MLTVLYVAGALASIWGIIAVFGSLTTYVAGCVLGIFCYGWAHDKRRTRTGSLTILLNLMEKASLIASFLFFVAIIIYLIPTPSIYGNRLDPPKSLTPYSATLNPSGPTEVSFKVPIPASKDADFLAIRCRLESFIDEHIEERIQKTHISIQSAKMRPPAKDLPIEELGRSDHQNKIPILFILKPREVSEVSVKLIVKAFICTPTKISIYVSYDWWSQSWIWRIHKCLFTYFRIKPYGST